MLSADFNEIGTQLAAVGATLSVTLTPPLVSLAVASADAANAFESSVAAIAAETKSKEHGEE